MARTVLIVDDVPFVRKTLTEILTQAHYQVLGEAADGEEAIEKYKILRPDLVTMDIVMPKLSGIEATHRICKMDKSARVVVVSAMSQVNLVMEAIQAGAKDYLMKPFSAEDVLKAVDRVFVEFGKRTDAGSEKVAG